MSKKLKLAGVVSYVNPLTENIVIKKGEVVLVSDAAAASMLVAKRPNAEGEDTFYWVEVENDAVHTYDFSENVMPGAAAKTATAIKNEEASRSTAKTDATPARTRVVGKSGQRAAVTS